MESTKEISILCINDFHAEIAESEVTLGSAKLVSVIKQYKQAHPNTIVVFGGDNYRGDPVSEYFVGEPVSKMIKIVGSEVSAVGNHEFDYGRERLEKWQRQGEFTFLAANVIDKQTKERPHFFQPYKILEVECIKVAFIGLATKEALDNVDRPQDIHSLEITDGVEAAREWITYLNDGHDPLGRPDVIIALTHFGLKYAMDNVTPVGEEVITLSQHVPELHGIFTAHWHQFMSLEINQVPVAQGGAYGRGISTMTFQLSANNEVLQVTPGFVDYSSQKDTIVPDEEMQQMIDTYYSEGMKELGVIIGYAKEDIVHRSDTGNEVDPEGTPLSKLGTDVLQQVTGCPIALFYSGRMGKGFKQGAITLYQLQKMLFFRNGIVTMKISGRDLIRNIEHGICTLKQEGASPLAIAGLNVTADYAKPYQQRIETITLSNGKPLEAEEYYEIAMDEYIASNEMGYDFSNGVDRMHTGLYLRDCMIQRIKTDGYLDGHFPNNFILKNKIFY